MTEFSLQMPRTSCTKTQHHISRDRRHQPRLCENFKTLIKSTFLLLASIITCTQTARERQSLWDNTEYKLPYPLPVSVFVDNFRLISEHDYLQRRLNRIGLKYSPMRRLYGDAEEMDLDHIRRCQSVTDAVDSVTDRYRWWISSKSHWIARQKMGDIPIIDIRHKGTFVLYRRIILRACHCYYGVYFNSV